MVRTQINLSKGLHYRAKQLAKTKGITLAALMRESLEHYLQNEIGQCNGTFDDLIALNITGGPKDLSTRMDDYLYGDG